MAISTEDRDLTAFDTSADRRAADAVDRDAADGGGIKRRGTLLLLLLLCLGGGSVIGLIFSDTAATYATLDVPSWAPPTWVFGPVWAVLYTLMAVSAWLVVRTEGARWRTRALIAFWVQLALNFAWTPLFFGVDERFGALIVIVELLFAAGWWTVEAFRTRRLAGLLQLPYLAWLTVATALNGAIALG